MLPVTHLAQGSQALLLRHQLTNTQLQALSTPHLMSAPGSIPVHGNQVR